TYLVNAIEGAIHKREPKSRAGSIPKGVSQGISTVADAITVGEATNQAVHKRQVTEKDVSADGIEEFENVM
ncbi:hypothetical protein HDV06_002621, partial [Boothiomyces sp. JEL0866]